MKDNLQDFFVGKERASLEEVRQTRVASEQHQAWLRVRAAEVVTLEAANAIADVVEVLIMAQANPRTVERVARMADVHARRHRPFTEEIMDVRTLKANLPVVDPDGSLSANLPADPDGWIGARGEGEEL